MRTHRWTVFWFYILGWNKIRHSLRRFGFRFGRGGKHFATGRQVTSFGIIDARVLALAALRSLWWGDFNVLELGSLGNNVKLGDTVCACKFRSNRFVGGTIGFFVVARALSLLQIIATKAINVLAKVDHGIRSTARCPTRSFWIFALNVWQILAFP